MSGSLYPMTEAALNQAASVVRNGGVIAFPTETFYGLGVTPWDSAAVQRLFALKGRSSALSPILVLIRHRKDLESLIAEISPSAELLMKACWQPRSASTKRHPRSCSGQPTGAAPS